MSITSTETTESAVASRFQADVAAHEMTVLRDDGLYRHLRFRHMVTMADGRASASSAYWFDLVTWPGCLAVNGDMGTYVFSRVDDMFGFFRGARINPGYWAEKVRGNRDGLTRYSEERFREHVTDAVKAAEGDYPGLVDAADEYFFGHFAEWNTEHGHDAAEGLRQFRYLPPGDKGEPFTFTDAWEWDLTDWDWHYLWCCHAIQWGIAQYDKAAAAKAVAA